MTYAIRWLAGDASPLKVEGKGLVEIYGWETEPVPPSISSTSQIHIPAQASHATLTPLENRLRVVLRDAKAIKQSRLLRANQNLTIHQSGRNVEFIPTLADYEVAVLER